MSTAVITEPETPAPPQRAHPLPPVLDSFFPAPAQRQPVTPGRVLLVLVAIAVGTVVSLARTTGTGALQSVWQEDAKNVLNDAYNVPFLTALFRPINGYLTVVPRIIGELATWFPVRYAAAVLSTTAAVITAALAVQVYVASGAHVRNRAVRIALAAPMLFAPVAEDWLSEIYNRPVGLHFFAAYAAFWVLLWTPAGRLGKTGAMATIWGGAASSLIFAGLIPLAALRLYRRRDWYSAFLLLPLVLCALVNLEGSHFGLAVGARSGGVKADPIWALVNFVVWGVPQSLLGFRLTQGLPGYPGVAHTAGGVWLIVFAWAIVAAVVGLAVVGQRRGLLRPQWMLSALLAVFTVMYFSFLVLAGAAIEQRYLLPIELLVYASLLVLLIPAPGPRWALAGAPLAAFAVLILVTGAFNYRFDNTFRAHAPKWTNEVARAEVLCKRGATTTGHVNLRGGPQPWASIVSIPCSVVLKGKSISCWPPECAWVDPPKAVTPTGKPN